MIDPRRNGAGAGAGATPAPRRTVVRALEAAGAALLGAVGLSAMRAERASNATGAEEQAVRMSVDRLDQRPERSVHAGR